MMNFLYLDNREPSSDNDDIPTLETAHTGAEILAWASVRENDPWEDVPTNLNPQTLYHLWEDTDRRYSVTRYRKEEI